MCVLGIIVSFLHIFVLTKIRIKVENTVEVNRMVKTENNLISRDIRIKASPELWAAFEDWLKRLGCTTVPEGFRTAMRIVTNFNSECQVKTANGSNSQ
jgi:hypothetical protein